METIIRIVMKRKKGFGNYSKDSKDPIVTQVLSLAINDEILGKPIYVHDIKSEADTEKCSSLPLIYIWNEDRACGTFSLSINGSLVTDLLELFCHKSDPNFIASSNEIIKVLSIMSQNSAIKTCQKVGCMPSDMLSSSMGEK